MKTARILACACALAALAFLAGCESAPAHHPKVTRDCVLTPGAPVADVDVGIETAIRVVLPGPQEGSPLAWEIAENNVHVLEQMNRPTKEPGASSTTVTFYTLKTGRSVLRFVLVDPAQREAVPAAIAGVIIHVRED